MKTEEYLFNKTVSERKRMSYGARAKKNGSKSKRCSLPSDNLTAKQRKELNGKVVTIYTNKTMSWKEFRKLSPGLQDVYLKTLFIENHARGKDVAELFGINEKSLRAYAHYHKIKLDELAKKSNGYRKMNPTKEWLAFLSNSKGDSEQKPEEVSDAVKEEKSAPAPSQCVKLDVPDESVVEERKTIELEVVSGDLNYKGDPSAVFTKALMALDPSKQYHIQIRFREVVE